MAFVILGLYLYDKYGQKQESKLNSVLDITNQNTTNILQRTMNDSISQCNITQTIDFTNMDNINCKGDFNITNKSSSLCNMSSVFQNTSLNSIKDTLKSSLKQTLTSGNEATQGFLGGIIGGSQHQSNIQDIENKFNNIIDTNITSEIVNKCIVQSNPNQFVNYINTNKIDIGGDCNFTNKTQAKVMASCFTDIIFNTALSNNTITEADIEADIKNSTKAKGLDEMISDILAGISGPIKAIIIGIAVVIIVVIFGALAFLLSPAGQSSINNLTDSTIKK